MWGFGFELKVCRKELHHWAAPQPEPMFSYMAILLTWRSGSSDVCFRLTAVVANMIENSGLYRCAQNTDILKNRRKTHTSNRRDRGVARCWRALAALTEDPGSTACTHVVTYNLCPSSVTPVSRDLISSPGLQGHHTHVIHIHTYILTYILCRSSGPGREQCFWVGPGQVMNFDLQCLVQ